jgi:hypothetical protein
MPQTFSGDEFRDFSMVIIVSMIVSGTLENQAVVFLDKMVLPWIEGGSELRLIAGLSFISRLPKNCEFGDTNIAKKLIFLVEECLKCNGLVHHFAISAFATLLELMVFPLSLISAETAIELALSDIDAYRTVGSVQFFSQILHAYDEQLAQFAEVLGRPLLELFFDFARVPGKHVSFSRISANDFWTFLCDLSGKSEMIRSQCFEVLTELINERDELIGTYGDEFAVMANAIVSASPFDDRFLCVPDLMIQFLSVVLEEFGGGLDIDPIDGVMIHIMFEITTRVERIPRFVSQASKLMELIGVEESDYPHFAEGILVWFRGNSLVKDFADCIAEIVEKSEDLEGKDNLRMALLIYYGRFDALNCVNVIEEVICCDFLPFYTFCWLGMKEGVISNEMIVYLSERRKGVMDAEFIGSSLLCELHVYPLSPDELISALHLVL